MGSWPPKRATIQAIHDRFQREIVEGLGLCPFARRSRELGRVHRPLFVVPDQRELAAEPVARALAELVAAEPDAEIVLLTFPVPPGHRWGDPAAFEAFLVRLREAWSQLPPPRPFYLVSFHPRLSVPDDRPLTPDSLVSLLRRSPDPVIQCVDAQVLDRVRRQAQATARERMLRELQARDPELAALFAGSISPDPELSSDIARQNFAAHGGAQARAQLDARIEALLTARDLAYIDSEP